MCIYRNGITFFMFSHPHSLITQIISRFNLISSKLVNVKFKHPESCHPKTRTITKTKPGIFVLHFALVVVHFLLLLFVSCCCCCCLNK